MQLHTEPAANDLTRRTSQLLLENKTPNKSEKSFFALEEKLH